MVLISRTHLFRVCLFTVISIGSLSTSAAQQSTLWTCENHLVWAVRGDVVVLRTDATEFPLQWIDTEVDNLGDFNALGHRRTDNCLYGIVESPERVDVVKLSPTGQYEVIKKLEGQPFYRGLLAGTISLDDRYLIALSAGLSVILKIDLIDLAAEPQAVFVDDQIDDYVYGIFEFAMNPIDGLLYGTANSYDVDSMYVIDPVTGRLLRDKSYPIESFYPAAGFGNDGYWYGFGPNEDGTVFLDRHDPITRTYLDRRTAALPLLDGQGGYTDGAKCIDNRLHLRQLVAKDTLRPCQQTRLTVTLSQFSDTDPETLLTLRESLPAGLLLDSVLYNPYGGTVSGIGTNELRIDDLLPKPGYDSIVLRVRVDDLAAPGVYALQAELTGPLTAYGVASAESELRSDNPRTAAYPDPDFVTILSADDPPPLERRVVFCAGDAVVLDTGYGALGYEHRWQDGGTSSSRTVTEAGIYQVDITDVCGATVPFLFTVEEAAVSIRTEDEVRGIAGSPVQLSADIQSAFPLRSVVWRRADTDLLTCDAACDFASVLVSGADTVRLTAVDVNGCTATTTIRLFAETPVFVPTAFSPNGDSANETFYIHSSVDLGIRSFRVWDRWGGLVFATEAGTTNRANEGWDGTVAGERAPSGLYLWQAVLVHPTTGEPHRLSGEVNLLR